MFRFWLELIVLGVALNAAYQQMARRRRLLEAAKVLVVAFEGDQQGIELLGTDSGIYGAYNGVETAVFHNIKTAVEKAVSEDVRVLHLLARVDASGLIEGWTFKTLAESLDHSNVKVLVLARENPEGDSSRIVDATKGTPFARIYTISRSGADFVELGRYIFGSLSRGLNIGQTMSHFDSPGVKCNFSRGGDFGSYDGADGQAIRPLTPPSAGCRAEIVVGGNPYVIAPCIPPSSVGLSPIR